MPKYQKCGEAVTLLAGAILCEFPTHKPTLDARVKIDYVFAFADRDDAGNILGCAIKHRGIQALGLCRKVSLKDRVMGRGDVEITLDGDWWESHDEDEQRSLLDHELHHILVQVDSNGKALTDDFSRPKISMRPHDVEVGWFSVIAARHGKVGIERRHAAQIMQQFGQMFWPELTGSNS